MWQSALVDATLVLRVVLLTCTGVFAAIAARGYRGTPWGAVLRPLPVAMLAFVLSVSVRLFDPDAIPVSWLAVLAWLPAIAAVALSTYRLVALVSRRRVIG